MYVCMYGCVCVCVCLWVGMSVDWWVGRFIYEMHVSICIYNYYII